MALLTTKSFVDPLSNHERTDTAQSLQLVISIHLQQEHQSLFAACAPTL